VHVIATSDAHIGVESSTTNKAKTIFFIIRQPSFLLHRATHSSLSWFCCDLISCSKHKQSLIHRDVHRDTITFGYSDPTRRKSWLNTISFPSLYSSFPADWRKCLIQSTSFVGEFHIYSTRRVRLNQEKTIKMQKKMKFDTLC